MQVLLVHLKNKISITVPLLFVVILFFGFFGNAFAAQVEISPATGTYSNGQSFTATIQLNPQTKSVNAVEAKLSFDNTKLSVVSVSKTGSVFSLWTTEPTFSNTAGTIDFGGGTPTPFSSRSSLITVTFRALAEDTAKVSVASASVLAADGLGTDVYTGSVNATYTISGTTPTPPTPTTPPETTKPTTDTTPSDAAITFGEPPRAPEAGSTTYLDSEVWYATKQGVFKWELPFDVDTVALDIATSSDFKPVTIYDPPIKEYTTSEEVLHDGIQYLTLQFKNQVGWGAILHRKIMIDSEPPRKFTIDVRAGNSPTEFPTLTFEAQDVTSGIAKYEMSIAKGEAIEVTPDMARLGYLLKNLENGTYTVNVTAYDLAGNKREASVAVMITAGWHPPVVVAEVTSVWDLFKGKNLIILLLILTIIGLVIQIFVTRKQQERKEQKLRKETKEIQDQMEKIFSALRDEIYDQINMITKRERLSKKEKEAVEGLSQALEVSETLIEKEITDVSKILK